MFGYKNTAGRTLILASVLTLTGGYAFAQRGGQGPGEGQGPPRRQADGEGQRQRGPRDDAGQRGPRGPRDGAGIQRRLFADMDLTDEQKEQIQAIMKKHGDERRAWHEAHRDEFQAIREKMRDARDADDKEAMDAVREEMHALMDSAPKPDATHDEIRAILTEEQQVTFDQRIANMRERAQQWRERRSDGPPPPGADGPPPGRRSGQLFANLNLTEEQQTKVREVMQSDKTREEKMTAVRGLLTEEQQAQLDENIERMRQWREQNQGDRPRRGDGPRGPRDDRPRGDRPPRGGDRGGDDKLDL